MSSERRNRIKATIYGQEYTIVGTDDTEHMHKVARSVDELMRAINAQNKELTETRLAVLTAVNATHEKLLLEQEYKKLEQELLKYKGKE